MRLCILFVFFWLQFRDVFAYDEPDNFAGLKFNKDLTQQIKPCPMIPGTSSGVSKPSPRKDEKCYVDQNGYYELYGINIYKGDDGILAKQLDGKLARVSFWFLNSRNVHGSAYFAILKQRYGAPTNVTRGPGSGTQASWTGKRVSIIFYERTSSDGRGNIVYYTNEWLAHENKADAEAMKKGASGL